MQIIDNRLNGVLVLESRIFSDDRGYFFESFKSNVAHQLGIPDNFVQDNQSLTKAGVIRGLHFQNPPHAQAKLVRVMHGKVLDVVVDIRKDSPTYGQHFKIELSGQNNLALYVPVGFAHGFTCLADNTIFTYKCSAYYNPQAEGGLMYNDPALGIDWEIENPILSPKDLLYSPFNNFISLF